MSLLAFNSCGHLANHLDVAPSFSSITFGISNTIVKEQQYLKQKYQNLEKKKKFLNCQKIDLVKIFKRFV